jgi:hypothetical protein
MRYHIKRIDWLKFYARSVHILIFWRRIKFDTPIGKERDSLATMMMLRYSHIEFMIQNFEINLHIVETRISFMKFPKFTHLLFE